MRKTSAWMVAGIFAFVGVLTYVWTGSGGPDSTTTGVFTDPNPRVPQDERSVHVSADDSENSTAGLVEAALPVAAVRRSHPLLQESRDAILVEEIGELDSTAGPKLTNLIREVVQSGQKSDEAPALTIDYPLNESIFPPEIVAPTFLWQEPTEQADTWLIEMSFEADSGRIYVLSPGDPPPSGEIDPACMGKNNEIHKPTPYQASAKSWTPDGDVWAEIKRRSVGLAATLTILGFQSSEPTRALSRGRTTITTCKDPVGAPIFYRDVPLAPALTQKGVIKPLAEGAVTLIAWRLRDISRSQSRLLLTDVPTCTNCHSFSADGNLLGMDLDGPQGDKGAYVFAPISKQMVIEDKDVISWNSFQDKPKGHKTIGFLSRVSPDGRYAVTTVNEAMYVCNFINYKFLQVFFPTRGILAYYSSETGQIQALPGADDASYVHCDAVWSPDGENLVFARAEAKDPYTKGRKLAERANDEAETKIQYDLYRIPFNGGRGGKPEPVAGASSNGMSNTFPKVSPDGKWIVFVKCRNGQLMRPDSRLWIVPAIGGQARLMNCNTRLMNSWHSFSPNGRWMVFSSKANTPYTQMFLTHIDDEGNDSPAILIPNSTAANRAVNIPEFISRPYDDFLSITVPAIEYLKLGLQGAELAKKGEFDEAMEHFDKAIQLRPDHLRSYVNAAVALMEQGKADEALARLERALELDPKNSHAHGSMGVVLVRKGKIHEALTQFQTAVQLNPNYREAHSNLGKVLMETGRLEEATEHFQLASELDAEDPLGQLDLGNVLLARGKLDEAVACFERSVKLEPRFVAGRLMLGNLLAAKGSFEAAVVQLQEAVAVAPGDLKAINDLAWLLTVCQDDDIRDGAKAIQLIEPACKETGYRVPVLLSTLAAAYAEVGRFPEAVTTATKALGLVDPKDEYQLRRIRQHLECYRNGSPFRYTQSGAPD